MTDPIPQDDFAGHVVKVFCGGLVAFLAIAIAKSAGDGAVLQLMYWSLIGLFVASGAVLGLLAAHQVTGRLEATSPEESASQLKVAEGLETRGETGGGSSSIPYRRPPSSSQSSLNTRSGRSDRRAA
ncbi:MAG: hypothetical protein KDA80_24015 [Planctomycetaceae bacterium]|nr:hypothetical protein [Planctomycetaceae bacterium]